MNETRLDLLREMPIFGGLRDDLLEVIGASARRVSIPRGSFFFREGEEGGSLFVLERGRVSIAKEWGGRSHSQSQLKQGDCFGELSLLDLGRRSASIRADDDCVALELTSAEILRICQSDVEQLALVYMNMARELARRLRSADRRLFELRRREPPGSAYGFRTT